jgi:carbamate kinase
LKGNHELTNKATKDQPLIVTTAHRGVFFGYGQPTDEKVITVKQARMCVYWSTDVHGILGLGATGPSKSCKVTAAVPEFTIQDVTGIAIATPEAAKAWEQGPWAR